MNLSLIMASLSMLDNIQFDPMAFVENLPALGVGMLGIFVVIAVIMGATYLLNALFKNKTDGQ